VVTPDSTRKLAYNVWAKTIILLIFISSLAVFAASRPYFLLQGADFPHFYCAARMLADGHGRQLYDADIQRQYQARYVGRVGTLYTHPPFETLLYLAGAWLPLRYSYLLWSLLTMALLAAGARRLAEEALPAWDWRILVVLGLTFIPSVLSILQGQDSLLLLVLVILAFTSLRRQRGFSAGCSLGLGLFKFQLALPLVLVLILTQGKNVRLGLAKGFGLTVLALAGVSAVISGWFVFTTYPKFLLHFKEQPFGGLVPRAMANFRGLTYFLLRRDESPAALFIIAILSAVALFMTVRSWKRASLTSNISATECLARFDLAFANTVIFALLTCYHFNPHDLSLLLLPIALLLRAMLTQQWRPAKWMTVGLLGMLFLPPLHLWALADGAYGLIGIPLLLLFLTTASIRLTTPEPSL
jgi:hypothetical protein